MSPSELFSALTHDADTAAIAAVRRELQTVPRGKSEWILCTITVSFEDHGMLVVAREDATLDGAIALAVEAAADAVARELRRRGGHA